MVNLVKQRGKWLSHFRSGGFPSSQVLQDYRHNRDSESWRVSASVEELCEYILYLEEQVNEWAASCEYNYKLYNDLMGKCNDIGYR